MGQALRRRGSALLTVLRISAALAARSTAGAFACEPDARNVGRRKRLPHLRRGSALLMVLWISAALAAVAFSLANTVRGETDRTSTELDEVRGYYLAVGAVDRADDRSAVERLRLRQPA